MGWSVEVTEPAFEDVFFICDWYDKQQTGMREKFLSALESAKSKLVSNHFAFAIWKKEIRRIILVPFAYKIYYKVYADRVIIFLVAHERRSDRYLKKRAKKEI